MHDLIGQIIAWTTGIFVLTAGLSLALGWLYICVKVAKYAWGV